MQFISASCYFHSLMSKHTPQHFIFEHPYLCSSLRVGGHVSHPYKTPDLYTLMFTCLDSRCEDKRLCTEW